MSTVAWYDRDRLAAWRARGTSNLVVPPAAEPVDVGMLMAQHTHLTEVDTADQWANLPIYISAAREMIEQETQMACLSQTWSYTIDAAPYCGTSIVLPISPVISVTSVTSYDLAGTPTVISPSTYLLDKSSRPARVVLNDGISWPGSLRAVNGIVVVYVAGYGTAAESVPARLRQAILLLAAEFYDQREAASVAVRQEIPIGVERLIGPLKPYGAF